PPSSSTRPRNTGTRRDGRHSSVARRKLILPFALRAVRYGYGLLVDVEAERLLALDVPTRHPDEEGVVTVLDRVDIPHCKRRRIPSLVHELPLERDVGVACLAAVVEPTPPAHPRGVLIVPVDDPAWTVIVHRGFPRLLAAVDEHVHVRLRIVTDRRTLGVGHGIAKMLLQEVRVVEQLLQVTANLRKPRRDPLRLDGHARVGEELIERVGSVGAQGVLISASLRKIVGRRWPVDPPWTTSGFRRTTMAIKLPDSAKKLLQDKAYGHIVTVGANGRPQVTMVWVDAE